MADNVPTPKSDRRKASDNCRATKQFLETFINGHKRVVGVFYLQMVHKSGLGLKTKK